MRCISLTCADKRDTMQRGEIVLPERAATGLGCPAAHES